MFTEEKYRSVSTDAKMLYGLLLDRMHLSAKNGWTDKRGRIYQFFTVKEAQEKLRFGHEKICRLFSELEQADLIVRKRQGLCHIGADALWSIALPLADLFFAL